MIKRTKQFCTLLILINGLFWGCAVQKTTLISTPLSGTSGKNTTTGSSASVSSNSTGSAPEQSTPSPGSDQSTPSSVDSKAGPEVNPQVRDDLKNNIAPAPPPQISSNEDSAPQISQELPPLEESDLEDDSEDKDSDEPVYDMPIVRNETVEEYINYYQKRNRPHFELWLSRSGRYLPVMKEVFKSFDLPEDLVFLALIESGFNPYAFSRSKAAGPWQFMKATGKKYGLKTNRWVDERRDPIKSTFAAAKYLKDLYSMFGSWPLALASYNAGEGRVLRAMARTKAEDFWDLSSTRYLRPETKNYVPQFMAATIIAKNPEKYGFSMAYYEPMKFDTVLIDRSTDLRVVARVVHSSYEVIKELNPELKKGMTPPLYPNYPLRIPEGTKTLFEENFRKIPEYTKVLKQKHRVRRGETLLSLSKRYGIPIQALAETNRIEPTKKIRRGQILIIPLGKADQTGESISPSAKANLKMGASYQGCPGCKTPKRYTLYKVKKGDTLFSLSKKHDIKIASILTFNNIHVLKLGTLIRLPLKNTSIDG
ncbi:MAG: transglycosylase SLT domain-containing protein [Nitrospirae bacterium]|nr:transglycosylase SLT domain-containing protein [Nitrospirota bacterium]MBI3352594.1 transglycosylase SLT domain-containing protein [Nitrospirota bacterium]